MASQVETVDHELLQTDPLTLSAWILTQQHRSPGARGRLTVLLNAIGVGCKFVASAVRRAGLAGMMGMAGSENVQGEDQKKLDVIANEVFKNSLRRSGQCCILITEEEDEPIFIEKEHRGIYIVVRGCPWVEAHSAGLVGRFLQQAAPQDAVDFSVGTIFGIYKAKDPQAELAGNSTLEDVLRPGTEMVAAGYCMYGSMAYMMITTGNGVAGFTLDPTLGEFVITHPKVQVPPRGTIYSINEGNAANWDPATTKYVENCKSGQYNNGKPYSLRYVGSMVADVHRTLLYGGIFMYPADKKSPSGKLRVLYECFPMAFLVEQAGGKATTGTSRTMEIVPTSIHGRAPIYLGSKEEVEEIERLKKECGCQ
ncbi:hypothetical protein COHA_007026 [Chlorella ohadii]|uniref:Fructose-1,6-bisphosphatase, cytosolic n=1 Tax=Chlorella ohadii TaxID=2649997 RepID=A0AAD5DMU8_9CHLO|nr:hypothetical protein COHA_007026 [Chlorella ohadii]